MIDRARRKDVLQLTRAVCGYERPFGPAHQLVRKAAQSGRSGWFWPL